MAQLTQLNLEGKPEKQTTQNVEKRDLSTRFSGKQKKAAIVGSVMITTLVGVFFLSTSGCSKKQSEKSAEVSGNQPMLTASTSNLASTTAPPASQPALPKRSAKRSPQRKSHATTYTSQPYLQFFSPISETLRPEDGRRGKPGLAQLGAGADEFC